MAGRPEGRSCATCVAARLGASAGAQAPKPSLASPNAAGVSMGHLHYRVRDVAANRRFWMALGGQPLTAARRFAAPGREILRFQDVLVVLDPGETTGGTEGSVVNHVAFRIPSLAPVEGAGLVPARLAQFPGVSSVMSPENERIELFENTATNLTFAAGWRRPGCRGRTAQSAARRADRLPSRAPVPARRGSRRCRPRPGTRRCLAASRESGHNTTPRTCRASTSTSRRRRGPAADEGAYARPRRLRGGAAAELLPPPRGMGVVFDELFAEGRDGVGRARSPIRGARRLS